MAERSRNPEMTTQPKKKKKGKRWIRCLQNINPHPHEIKPSMMPVAKEDRRISNDVERERENDSAYREGKLGFQRGSLILLLLLLPVAAVEERFNTSGFEENVWGP